jgi:hypothetical protein
MPPLNKEGWYDLWERDSRTNDRFFDILETILAALFIAFLTVFIINQLFIV